MNTFLGTEKYTAKEFKARYSDIGRGRDQRRQRDPQWSVANIWESHHEIIRYLMLGYKNVEISRKMNLTVEHISNIRNSPIIQERLSLMVAARDVDAIEISRDILKVVPKSLELLKSIIDGTGDGEGANIGLRAKVAESNLDRAGFGAVKKVVSETHNYYTDEDIEMMKQRAFENSDIIELASEGDGE